MRPTPEDIAKWKAEAEAATEGPWEADGPYMSMSGGGTWYLRKADARHIASARTAVPALCEEVIRLREALEGAAEWLEGWASAEPYLSTIRAALDPSP